MSVWQKKDNAQRAKVVNIVPSELENDREPLELVATKLAIERGGLLLPFAGKLVHLVGIMIVVSLIWAAVAHVDVVAKAPGHLIPMGNVREIAPVADGVIDELLVKDGQTVKAGSSLVRLDRTPFEAEMRVRSKELAIAENDLKQHQLAADTLKAVIKNPERIPDSKVEFSNIGQLVNQVYTSHAALKEAEKDISSLGRKSLGDSEPPGISAMPTERVSLFRRLEELKAERTSQRTAFLNRRQELAKTKEMSKIRISSTKAQLATSKEQIEKLEAILAQTREQERAYKNVWVQGAVSRVDYLSILKLVESEEIKLMEQRSLLASLTHQLNLDEAAEVEVNHKSVADLAQQEAEIRKLSEQIANVGMQLRGGERHQVLAKVDFEGALDRAKAALSQELVAVENATGKVEQNKAALKAAEHAFAEAEIKAPVEGTVTGIRVRGKGQVVSHREHLMTLVPCNSPLVVECYLNNKDAGFVRSGQPAKIKLAAFPFQDFGCIKGKVTLIESNAEEKVTRESKAEEKNVHDSHYRVLIQPERTWIYASDRRIDFTSGMAVTAEIVTRHRSILSILFEPIQNLRDTTWN